MSDDAHLRRATALESPTAVVDDPDEQVLVRRLRVLLGGPTTWSGAPELDLGSIMASGADDDPAADRDEADHLDPERTTVIPSVESQAETMVIPPVPGQRDRREPDRPAGRRDPVRPADRPRAGGWRSRRSMRLAAGLAAAALVLVVAGIVGYRVTRPEVETATFALAGAGAYPAASASVHAADTAAGWHVTLSVRGLPPAPVGSYYEAWLGRGADLVPLGTFHNKKPGKVELWSGVDLPAGSRFVVTIQRVGNLQPQDVVLTGVVRR